MKLNDNICKMHEIPLISEISLVQNSEHLPSQLLEFTEFGIYYFYYKGT